MDGNIVKPETQAPAQHVPDLPVLPPRPSSGPSPAAKSAPPPLPHRPDLAPKEKDNHVVESNKINSLERPPRNKARGKPEITIVSARPMGTSTIPPPSIGSSGIQAPPLPSRPPPMSPAVPQLPVRPSVDPPQLPDRPPLYAPPLPVRLPPDTPKQPERPSVNAPQPSERPPADTEPCKGGPPPRPKSTPVSTTGETEQNGLPPLSRRDLPEIFPTAVESTTSEKSPEQPQAPPRRPKRGPTVINAPPKPLEDELQKTQDDKITEKPNKPADIRQTKDVLKTNSSPQVVSPAVPTFALKPCPMLIAAKPKELWQPPQLPSKIPKDTKKTSKNEQNSLASSQQEKEMTEQTKKKMAAPSKGLIFAPLPTGQVRGLVLKKLSQDIATLKEHQTKPIEHAGPQKEKVESVPKPKPRPTIISAKRPEKEQPRVEESHGNGLSSKQDTQESLETKTPKSRPTVIIAKPPKGKEKEETSPLTSESSELVPDTKLKTDSMPSPPVAKLRPTIITTKTKPSPQSENVKLLPESTDNVGSPTDEKGKPEVVPLKPKPKPTIIVAKPPKLSEQVDPIEAKLTPTSMELETENTEKDVSSKTNAEKQDTQSFEVSKTRPKPTIIRAVKPPEKPTEQNPEERKEKRKTTETSSKPNGSASSPPPQTTKPKPTIIYAAKPPSEKRAAPPRPTRTPSVKTKPNKEKQQIQPKVETATRDMPTKKKAALPFSIFYVDIDEPAEVVETKPSSAPKTKDKTQNKVPQNRAPPPRPGSSKRASIKAHKKANEPKAPSAALSDTGKTESQSTENANNLELQQHRPAPTGPPGETGENAGKRKSKPRPPRPYSIAIGEVNLQSDSKPMAPEEKKTKPRPPRPRSLYADVKTTEHKAEADAKPEEQKKERTVKGKTKPKPETEETQDAGLDVVRREESSHEADETSPDNTTMEKPKPGRPAPVAPGKTKPKPACPAPTVSRHDKETPSRDKNIAQKPSKENMPEPVHTQVSSVCPTKIDPVAIALHDYIPTSADDLAFQAGAEILLLKRIDKQWLYGKCGQEEGMFPQSFVEVIEDLPVDSKTQEQESKTDQEEKSSSKVTALYDFLGSESDGELSFKEGSVIDVVVRISDEWLKGTFRGQTGMFPSNFVDCTNLHVISTEPVESIESNTKTLEVSKQERTDDISSGPRCRALHDYHSESPDDLSFVGGDIIRLAERINEEWLRGETAGRTGIFPAAFVQIIEDIVVSRQVKQETALWHAVALHDFISDSPGDLQFTVGTKIAVLEIVSEEWLKGRLDGEEGIFPTAFVEKQEKESDVKPRSLYTNVADSQKVETKSLRRTTQIPDEFTPKAKALYDFEGETEDEISFKTGDVICLLNQISDEWLSGELDNNVGRFPAAFVEILVPLP